MKQQHATSPGKAHAFSSDSKTNTKQSPGYDRRLPSPTVS